MIKRYLLIIITAFGFSIAQAQTPLTEAVDFTAKDVHGVQHHLFDILDNQEAYVFIDFFSVTCGPCQTIAPMVDSLYKVFGHNFGQLYVLGIDQNFNNQMVLEFEEEYNISYPAVSGIEGGGSYIFEDYQIPYYPSLILIAPNHTIVEQSIPVPTSALELVELMESYGLLPYVAVQEIDNPLRLNFYPNPVADKLNISSTIGTHIVHIDVYQITGQKIISQKNTNAQRTSQIDVAGLKKGLYLLSVEFASGKRLSKPFAKQ